MARADAHARRSAAAAPPPAGALDVLPPSVAEPLAAARTLFRTAAAAPHSQWTSIAPMRLRAARSQPRNSVPASPSPARARSFLSYTFGLRRTPSSASPNVVTSNAGPSTANGGSRVVAPASVGSAAYLHSSCSSSSSTLFPAPSPPTASYTASSHLLPCDHEYQRMDVGDSVFHRVRVELSDAPCIADISVRDLGELLALWEFDVATIVHVDSLLRRVSRVDTREDFLLEIAPGSSTFVSLATAPKSLPLVAWVIQSSGTRLSVEYTMCELHPMLGIDNSQPPSHWKGPDRIVEIVRCVCCYLVVNPLFSYLHDILLPDVSIGLEQVSPADGSRLWWSLLTERASDTSLTLEELTSRFSLQPLMNSHTIHFETTMGTVYSEDSPPAPLFRVRIGDYSNLEQSSLNSSRLKFSCEVAGMELPWSIERGDKKILCFLSVYQIQGKPHLASLNSRDAVHGEMKSLDGNMEELRGRQVSGKLSIVYPASARKIPSASDESSNNNNNAVMSVTDTTPFTTFADESIVPDVLAAELMQDREEARAGVPSDGYTPLAKLSRSTHTNKDYLESKNTWNEWKFTEDQRVEYETRKERLITDFNELQADSSNFRVLIADDVPNRSSFHAFHRKIPGHVSGLIKVSATYNCPVRVKSVLDPLLYVVDTVHRQQWDTSLESETVVWESCSGFTENRMPNMELINPNTEDLSFKVVKSIEQILHIKTKPVWPTAQRDAVVFRTIMLSNDMTRARVVVQSLHDSDCPGIEDGIVRACLDLNIWDFSYTDGKLSILYAIQFNPGGWIPATLIATATQTLARDVEHLWKVASQFGSFGMIDLHYRRDRSKYVLNFAKSTAIIMGKGCIKVHLPSHAGIAMSTSDTIVVCILDTGISGKDEKEKRNRIALIKAHPSAATEYVETDWIVTIQARENDRGLYLNGIDMSVDVIINPTAGDNSVLNTMNFTNDFPECFPDTKAGKDSVYSDEEQPRYAYVMATNEKRNRPLTHARHISRSISTPPPIRTNASVDNGLETVSRSPDSGSVVSRGAVAPFAEGTPLKNAVQLSEDALLVTPMANRKNVSPSRSSVKLANGEKNDSMANLLASLFGTNRGTKSKQTSQLMAGGIRTPQGKEFPSNTFRTPVAEGNVSSPMEGGVGGTSTLPFDNSNSGLAAGGISPMKSSPSILSMWSRRSQTAVFNNNKPVASGQNSNPFYEPPRPTSGGSVNSTFASVAYSLRGRLLGSPDNSSSGGSVRNSTGASSPTQMGKGGKLTRGSILMSSEHSKGHQHDISTQRTVGIQTEDVKLTELSAEWRVSQRRWSKFLVDLKTQASKEKEQQRSLQQKHGTDGATERWTFVWIAMLIPHVVSALIRLLFWDYTVGLILHLITDRVIGPRLRFLPADDDDDIRGNSGGSMTRSSVAYNYYAFAAGEGTTTSATTEPTRDVGVGGDNVGGTSGGEVALLSLFGYQVSLKVRYTKDATMVRVVEDETLERRDNDEQQRTITIHGESRSTDLVARRIGEARGIYEERRERSSGVLGTEDAAWRAALRRQLVFGPWAASMAAMMAYCAGVYVAAAVQTRTTR